MEKKIVRFKKLRPDAVVPSYGTPFSAGADLCACIDGAVEIAPGDGAAARFAALARGAGAPTSAFSS